MSVYLPFVMAYYRKRLQSTAPLVRTTNLPMLLLLSQLSVLFRYNGIGEISSKANFYQLLGYKRLQL